MKEQNGIHIFEASDQPPSVGSGLDELDLTPFHFPYGVKVIEINGKKKLEPATLTDFQRSEGQRLGVDPATIKPQLACNQVGVRVCQGQCGAFQKCTALYNPVYKYWYCQCQ